MGTIIHCRIPRSGRVQRTPQAAIEKHNAWLEARGISTLVFRRPPAGGKTPAASLSPYSGLHSGSGVSHAERDTNNRKPTLRTSDTVPAPAAKRAPNKRRHDAEEVVAQAYHKGPIMVIGATPRAAADLVGSKRRS